MTAEQFAYWLQGHAELSDGPPSAEQWDAIKAHLQLVFTKVTPKLSGLQGVPYCQANNAGMVNPMNARVTC